MILVDSSVWIDYFKGVNNRPADRLDMLLGQEPLLIGDLILAEVLQGFTSEKDFRQARSLFKAINVVPLCGEDIAIQAARNYLTLQAVGVTVRKTIDTVIATRCIADELTLLHNDRDFDPFVKHLGLKTAV